MQSLTLLPQRPHSPDLAGSDFHLLRPLKETLRRQWLSNDNKVKEESVSYFKTLDKQRRTHRYEKYNLYFYSLTAMIVCSRNTVREGSHISFFCGGDPFCEVVRRLENRHGEMTGLLE